ncbi:MAG: metallophosphoesterase [Thermoleophilia bacterium]|nr:metallophosphoesterase [Thermoleophilia bacterium]
MRVAAAGDIHCSPSRRGEIEQAFARLDGADLVLLAGDLTTHGEPEQAAVLADAVRALAVPVVAVLGNHDWHSNRQEEIMGLLRDAGITVLNRSWTTLDVRGTRVGIVGTKGFVGGFPDSQLPDFGEPILRQVYAETTEEVRALEHGLDAIADCPVRIVLLHYAPTWTTLEGEPKTIWTFLGTDRMAPPIEAHRPDLVIHGHGHAGRFDGSIGDIPVFNVALPVIRRDFWLFELDGTART